MLTGCDSHTRALAAQSASAATYSVPPRGDFRQNEAPEQWGDGIVKTQGMTRHEVEAALALAGLDVPEREKAEIAAAAHVIEEMAQRVRGKRAMAAEPAHIFPPPGA